jgi:hypothetical protein
VCASGDLDGGSGHCVMMVGAVWLDGGGEKVAAGSGVENSSGQGMVGFGGDDGVIRKLF